MDGEQRKIVHIDMDAFYASVEQRDNPAFRNKPLIVGGSRDRGVVAAASYDARKFGIHSAMPSRTAIRRCPNLIIVKPRMDVYKEISMQIREIFSDFTDLIEPLSLDEAFLDVTRVKKGPPSATLIANEIRKQIFNKTGLTSSAGISVNKFLAKVASDINKPNGFFVIPPNDVIPFIEKLKIEKFFGVGRVTAEKMHKMGINNGSDLKQIPRFELERKFGKAGKHFFDIARGIDDRPVNHERIRKSVGAEKTFDKDLITYDELLNNLLPIAEKVFERALKIDFKGKTLTLKLKYNDFVQITRSFSYEHAVTERKIIYEAGKSLLRQVGNPEKPVRLLGLSVSNIQEEKRINPMQLTLDF
jgi:DNA polymerase-4